MGISAATTGNARHNGDKQIAAYFVPQNDQKPAVGELYSFLQNRLPEHMIPAYFMSLDALPLTPNGKIDRKQLPAPNTLQTQSREDFVGPRDELEYKLVKIWEKILDRVNIGVRDNFFQWGGNSIRAMRLSVAIEQVFNTSLQPTIFFQTPTIEDLANLLRGDKQITLKSSLVTIQAKGNKRPVFLSPGNQH